MADVRNGAVTERLGRLYTAAVTDVMDALGRLDQTLPTALRPLRDGMRVIGPAYPVEGRPAAAIAYDASLRRTMEMLGSVPAGHVAVYQTNDAVNAHLGELSVTSLRARGCAGAVIDGGCRDVSFILDQDYPVFCRHTTPQDSSRRWQVTRHGDVTVTVGGVRVAPGDWVLGDRDGIAVIPGEILLEVVERAEAKVSTENEIRDAVRAGMLPLDAFERFGTF